MFVSLDPPVDARREAAGWGRLVARSEPGLRPIGEEAIHLTLAFLGTVSSERVGALVGAIERTARPVPGIEGGAPVWLPRRRPRALALELRDQTGVLEALRADLIGELGQAIGWQPERSGFLPHLTVARAGRGFRPSGTALEVAPALRFEPEAITLYRSHLDPEGARYEPLFSLPVGPGSIDPDGPLPDGT